MALPGDFRLDHSSRNHREHSCPVTHKIVWPTGSANASPGNRVDRCVLAIARILEICIEALFQRQLVRTSAEGSGRYSPRREGSYQRIRFFLNPLAWLPKCS